MCVCVCAYTCTCEYACACLHMYLPVCVQVCMLVYTGVLFSCVNTEITFHQEVKLIYPNVEFSQISQIRLSILRFNNNQLLHSGRFSRNSLYSLFDNLNTNPLMLTRTFFLFPLLFNFFVLVCFVSLKCDMI